MTQAVEGEAAYNLVGTMDQDCGDTRKVEGYSAGGGCGDRKGWSQGGI